jgi:hypothetical protein
MKSRIGVEEVVDHDRLRLTSFPVATFTIVVADQHSRNHSSISMEPTPIGMEHHAWVC